MYRSNSQQLEFPDFYLPFSGHLDPENRWVALAQLVPWKLAEQIYHASLCDDFGAPIVPSRVALGALLIKERLGLTDRETAETIQENPYLQFFIGQAEFSQERPFDASLMVDFRKRFGAAGLQQIAEAIALSGLSGDAQGATSAKTDSTDDSSDPPSPTSVSSEPNNDTVPEKTSVPNQGRLIADASCAPADIRYPTDISLLNEAREKTEAIIDELHLPLQGTTPRPRTYRLKARRQFVAFTKRKKPGRKLIRRAKRQHLGYLRRNLQAIDVLLSNPRALCLQDLRHRSYKNMLVCREVYRQQLEMYEAHSQRVDDRIVSISQPHVRPIKRGKAGRDTEFGAKISLSVVEGFSFVDRLSWDNYNEGGDLPDQLQRYFRRFGFYPESVHVDQIYRTRVNRALCKSLGIRLSGPPLGRAPQNVSKADKKRAKDDEGIRNQVEGKFGEGKRRFSLARVMTKLPATSTAQVSLTFLVMNLELALRQFFLSLFFLCQGLAAVIVVSLDATGRVASQLTCDAQLFFSTAERRPIFF